MIKLIRRLLPIQVKKSISQKIKSFKFNLNHKKHKRQIKRIRKKDKINVAFFLINESIWKYDKLYFLLKQDKRFEPKVFICPFIAFGDKIMHQEMDKTFISFKNQGYDVVQTMKKDGSYLDVKTEFQPDLLFFSSPYNITIPQYRIDNYLDTLTCYVNYSYTTSNQYALQYTGKLQVYCWKYFLESKFHKEIARKYLDTQGKNTLVTGYAGTDIFLDPNYIPKDCWKKQGKRKKRIIWAPHHSIEGALKQTNLLNYSTFLKYSDLMFYIVEKYKEKIQIAFKPHPSLKPNLYQVWGEDKTEIYYKTWQELPNGQLEEGAYVDLFLQSDAMIHDSSSFLIEYLFIHKPVLYLLNNEESKKQYSALGKKALTKISQGYTQEDILSFINDTVLEGKDFYKDKRNEFFKEYLQPPHNRLASENIYYYLIEKLILK